METSLETPKYPVKFEPLDRDHAVRSWIHDREDAMIKGEESNEEDARPKPNQAEPSWWKTVTGSARLGYNCQQ